ncbi:neural-cadherin-like [Centruroides vittatus]|uniref:neural-cadherin-like n=1 Tax=Centruroides vittatus TaxID=120091 RepID=UPI00350E9009
MFWFGLSVVMSFFGNSYEQHSEHLVVAHDVYPGYNIKKLINRARSFSLINNEFSNYFTIFSDGVLIPTVSIAHFIDSSFTLIIREDYPNRTVEKNLIIHVMDKDKMLKFIKDTYLGSVIENVPKGSEVEGLDLFFATTDPKDQVKYQFIDGNEDNSFSIRQKSAIDTNLIIYTNNSLDRETRKEYNLTLEASNSKGDSAKTFIRIKVEDVNDNPPHLLKNSYKFQIPDSTELHKVIGKIIAVDVDGDQPLYHFSKKHSVFTIIPKTGQILLLEKPQLKTYKFLVEAHDNRKPRLTSNRVPVIIEVYSHKKVNENTTENQVILVRSKRSVRPTKTYVYKETDGSIKGKMMFHLEKLTNEETFKLVDKNRWIDIEENGSVKVKEPWDYEQLEKEKTIDFWVLIDIPRFQIQERQRVIIYVKDVNDESPNFINRPLPMQTVVQLNAPPGTPVFKLQARDPDQDHDIHYYLVQDQTGGRFEVDERSGEVRTLGSDPFMLNKEYVLHVKAEDRNGRMGSGSTLQYQSTGEKRLSIMGGKRPPQFYMSHYDVTIPENQKKDFNIIEVKAKSFADREIRYRLRTQGKGYGTFNIDPITGEVKLTKDLDYEDLRQLKSYYLIITATEDSGGFSTNVELIITVTDVNDNPPRFELPDYQAHNVPEDVEIGTSILQVSAVDMDQGKNSEIEYSIDKDEFTIDNKGIIRSNKRLDADIMNTYVLTVRATDQGDPPLTGTATVRVYIGKKKKKMMNYQNLAKMY